MLDNFESSSSQRFLEYTWYTGFGPMIVDCDALSEVLTLGCNAEVYFVGFDTIDYWKTYTRGYFPFFFFFI